MHQAKWRTDIKVLHILPSLARRYGGPSTTILPMVRYLREKGLSVDVATTDADGPHNSIDPSTLPDDLRDSHVFKRSFSETWKYSKNLSAWLTSNISSYDIVHIHAVWSFSTQAAARAAVAHKVPFVLRPAGMLSEFSWRHKGLRKLLYWQLIEKKTMETAAAFHATSLGEQHDIHAVRTEANVHIISNSIEDMAFEYPTTRPPDDAPPQILFLSRLHPKKGIIDRLLPAVARLNSPFALSIVGDEDTHYTGHRKEILTAIAALNLEDKVRLISGVSGDARWKYFDESSVFVLPSHSENFGIVVAEAMARGCPFVITKEVQAAPLFSQSGAGTVVSTTDELAASLQSILTSPKDRDHQSALGRSFAMNHFSGARVADRIVQMYESVLEAHARQ